MLKKRICFFTLTMEKGGAEMAIINMMEQLKDDYEIHLCLMLNTLQFKIPEGVQVHYIERRNHGNVLNILILPLLAWRYFRLLKRNRIEVSISFLERPNFIAVMAKMMGSGVRTIITVSSALSAWYSRDRLHGKIGRFLIKWLYPKADKVIPCAKYVEHELITDFGIGNARFRTIYNAVNVPQIHTLSQESLPVVKDAFWFIHLGSFYEVKNHRLLVDAFLQFEEKYPGQAKLLLIGKGHLLPVIRAYVAQVDKRQAVNVIGFAENPYNLIAAADCFVLSSNFEGLPTVLLESLACGTPVISTDCKSGPREILAPETDYKTFITEGIDYVRFGTLVPVGDVDMLSTAMEMMFRDEARRKKLRLNTEKALGPFNIQDMTDAYRREIESV